MKRKDRDTVFNKYGGRCAYCGRVLQKGWNVDEIEPVRRYSKNVYCKTTGMLERVVRGVSHPERFNIDNQNPACPRCNKWKSTFSLEQFREEISQQVVRLNNYSSNYRMAKDYGMVIETNIKVTFYFETLITKTNHNG